jgi:hypothetical protein
MLFQLLAEPLVLHSGHETVWKIECDALDPGDIKCLSYLIAQRHSPFSKVEGVPRGGILLAQALEQHRSPTGGLLIVDDVCTTGTSLEAHRAGREARGAVIFARGPCPSWAQALFVLR